jgi:hypothetical protein
LGLTALLGGAQVSITAARRLGGDHRAGNHSGGIFPERVSEPALHAAVTAEWTASH